MPATVRIARDAILTVAAAYPRAFVRCFEMDLPGKRELAGAGQAGMEAGDA